MPTATGQTPATTRQPPADGLSQGVRRPRGEKPHSSAAPTGATSLEKRSHENQRHAPWDPAATAFLGCAAPKVQVEGKHGSREVRAPLHRTASAFLIAGASGPRRVGEKVCIGSLRPLGSLPHSHSQAGLTARRQTTGLCWARWGARGGGDDRRTQDALSYPPACRPKAALNSRERVLAASVYHRKFKDCHLDLLKQTTTIVENE